MLALLGRTPALVPCLGVLAGIVLAPRQPGSAVVWAIAAALLCVCLPALLVAGRRPALLAALFCAGFCAGGCRQQLARDERAAVERWLPRAGRALELTVEARVLRAATPHLDGSWRLPVLARPLHVRHAAWARLSLAVGGVEPEGIRRVRALRRGDAIRAWCRIRSPRRFGNPGAHDPRRSLLAAGFDASGWLKSGLLLERGGVRSGHAGRLLDGMRLELRRRADHLWRDERVRAVLGALALGERADAAPRLVEGMRRAGLGHLLAISGLHVGLLTLPLLALARRTRAPPWAAALAIVPLLSSYAWIVGGRPSVVRATMAAGLLLAGQGSYRELEGRNAWAIAAAALALSDPWIVRAPGYQLSFAATAGLLWLGGGSRNPLRASAVAYLGAAPAGAWHFFRVTPIAPLSNLIGIPLAGAALFCAVAALVVEPIGWIAAPLARVAAWAVGGLAASAEHLGGLPGSWRVPAPAPALLVAYAVAMIVRARHGGGLPRMFLLVCVGALHLGPPPAPPAVGGAMHVIDVGQGQAIVVRGRDGFALVDCGSRGRGNFDVGERVVLPVLLRLGCRRIDTLVISHEHDDHAGGAGALLSALPVGELWVPLGATRHVRIRELMAQAHARGTAVRLVGRGLRRPLAGLPVRVLHPGPVDLRLAANERSLVLRLRLPDATVLIASDTGGRAEARMVARGEPLAASVLVAGHHGSRSSTSERWLRTVLPRHAVISAGADNRFGHPHPAVLRRLARHGVHVKRTDLHGWITIGPAQAK